MGRRRWNLTILLVLSTLVIALIGLVFSGKPLVNRGKCQPYYLSVYSIPVRVHAGRSGNDLESGQPFLAELNTIWL